MKAEKLFSHPDLAARAFGCEALPLTGIDARERGAVLYPVTIKQVDGNGQPRRLKLYTYGRIFTGGHNNVVVHVVLRYLLWLFMPKKISFLHTHPACTGHKPEVFSVGDEFVAKLWGVNAMYLASPGGNLYKHDGKSAKRDANGILILDKIYDNMPKISHKINCKQTLPKALTRTQAQIMTRQNQAYIESLKNHV